MPIEPTGEMKASKLPHIRFLPKWMRTMRERSGNSQNDVARKMNMTRSGIGHYETGSNQPPIEELIRYLEVCGYECRIIAVPKKKKPKG